MRSVGFAPVKGMRHLALDHVDLDEQGAVGDRAYCLVDVERRRVLRTVQHPSLMGIVAQAYDDGLALTLPTGEQADGPASASGKTITCDYWGRPVELALTDGPHAELISRQLGQDVRLARAPRTAVVFGDPITVVTTASLREMDVEAARFRATLVLDTDEPWVEDTWLGREIDLGGATVQDRRTGPALRRHRPPPRDGGEGREDPPGPRAAATHEQGGRADVRRLRHRDETRSRARHALTCSQSRTLVEAACE